MGISQEEIVTNTQTVTKGLEALRLEHKSLLGDLKNANEESNGGRGPAGNGPSGFMVWPLKKTNILDLHSVPSTKSSPLNRFQSHPSNEMKGT